MPYINSWCRIRNHRIAVNDQTVWTAEETDLAAFLSGAYRHFDIGYPKFYKMDRLSQLGFLAAELLLKDRFDKEKYPAEALGLVLANAHSSLDTDARYQQTLAGIPSPALFVYTLPNIVIGEICIRHQFKGEQAFFIFETFDIPFLNDYIDQVLESGAAQAVLGGWVDVLQEDYDVCLYLVEHQPQPGSIIHNQQNIRDIYGSLDTGS
ncbi:MAG: 3-oxoacyl-ACP synthase [Saprospiraceae bacterium]|nr:3-oxoacyl-ACP synthase [Saprospiraceae bacterium]